MTATPDQFLHRFRKWPKRTFPGALELLEKLSGNFQLACFSNTNKCHYEFFVKHQPIMERFNQQFLSYEMGIMKPKVEAFEHVVESLKQLPAEILFFDDSPTNVAAAQSLGINADCVNTPKGVIEALKGRSLHS